MSVSAEQHLEVRYAHNGGWPFFIHAGNNNLAFEFYVLGDVNTPYEFSAEGTAIRYDSNVHLSRETIGWASPGWYFRHLQESYVEPWRAGRSIAPTLTFNGAVYSKVKFGFTSSTESWYGNSGPGQPPYTVGGTSTYASRVSVRTLSPVPDIVATSIAWNAPHATVDYSYEIRAADLPQATTGGLYWSTDTAFDATDTAAGHTFPIGPKQTAQPVTGSVAAATLSVPPLGTKHLLLVVDDTNSVIELDEPQPNDFGLNNVQAADACVFFFAGSISKWIDHGGAMANIRFQPRGGLSLAASTCGVHHFNYLNEVKHDDDPQRPKTKLTQVQPGVPYLDPPLGGWDYQTNGDDYKPGYWNEDNGELTTYTNGDVSVWFKDAPSVSSSPFYIDFSTSVIGVDSNGHNAVAMGPVTDWTANSTGVSWRKNVDSLQIDEGRLTFLSDRALSDLTPEEVELLSREEVRTAPPPSEAPVLNMIEDVWINEGDKLGHVFTATKGTVTDEVTFKFLASPIGAGIDRASGEMAWMAEDGPRDILFQVLVETLDPPVYSDSQIFVAHVANARPRLTMETKDRALRGEEVTVVLRATDPSDIDQAAGFTYAIDWGGDGIVDANFFGGSPLNVQHTFGERGPVRIVVTATDKDGGTSDPSIHSLKIVDSLWQNFPEAFDVNDDGRVTPLDVLTLINRLNRFGPGPLTEVVLDWELPSFCDVNGDGSFSSLDVLMVINSINDRQRPVSKGEAELDGAVPTGPMIVDGGRDVGPNERELKREGPLQPTVTRKEQWLGYECCRVSATPSSSGNHLFQRRSTVRLALGMIESGDFDIDVLRLDRYWWDIGRGCSETAFGSLSERS